MSSIVKKLKDRNLIDCPGFLPTNTHYETLMGSIAYGVNQDDSDNDVYGFCIPPKSILFPHTEGYIAGFDKNVPKFEVWQQHHIQYSERKTYDLQIYNIVHYFRLCADGNPNMIDSLFTPANCILSMSQIGNLVRENRKLFLSKKCWHTFKGYAFAALRKLNNWDKFEYIKFCKEHRLPTDITLEEIEQELRERETRSSINKKDE